VYLDNLRCKDQINHKDIPRAKYFNQDLIKKIIAADKTKDDQGKVTFGRLPVRHSNYCPPILNTVLCVNAYLLQYIFLFSMCSLGTSKILFTTCLIIVFQKSQQAFNL